MSSATGNGVTGVRDRRNRHRSGIVVLIWVLMLAALSGVLFIYGSPTYDQQGPIQIWAVLLMATVAVSAAFLPRWRPRGVKVKRTGAPAMALAAAFLVAAVGWVFGVFICWFAVPLLAFCISRWRAEIKGGRPTP